MNIQVKMNGFHCAFYIITLSIFGCNAFKIPARVHIIRERSTSHEFNLLIDAKEHGVFRELRMAPAAEIWSEGALFTSLESNGEETEVITEVIAEPPQVYTDKNKKAALTVMNGKVQGIIDEELTLGHENGEHHLIKTTQAPNFGDDFIELNISNNAEDAIDAKTPVNVREKRSSTVYTVEIGVVVDQSFLSESRDALKSFSGTSKEKLVSYFSIFFNGVRSIYEPINWIEIKLSSVTTASFDNYFYARSDDYASASSTLNNFGRDLLSSQNNPSTVGLAFGSRACQSYSYDRKSFSTVIAEDKGEFQCGTAAHEIAHNLGARHDGKNNLPNKRCSPEDGFIMSPVARGNPNGVLFSECSIEAMKNYVTSSNANCLRNKNSENYLPSSQYPGTFVSLNRICQEKMEAADATYYRPEKEDKVCLELWCKRKNSYRLQGFGLPLPEGTECAKGKKCIRGTCT